MELIYTRKFIRSFKKLPNDLQNSYREKEKIFKINPFDEKLKTHKLQNSNLCSFSITYKIRVLFQSLNNEYYLIDIGDHSLYRKI